VDQIPQYIHRSMPILHKTLIKREVAGHFGKSTAPNVRSNDRARPLTRLRQDYSKAGYVGRPIESYLASDAVADAHFGRRSGQSPPCQANSDMPLHGAPRRFVAPATCASAYVGRSTFVTSL